MSDSSPASPHPKVFISYSWEPEKHLDLVLKLANKLRRDGIDCWIDQFEQNPINGWTAWMLDQIDRADYVLLVCSEPYYQAFRRHQDLKDQRGRGSAWETGYIVKEIYESKGQTRKFIPISFTLENEKSFPGVDGSTYGLYKKDGYESLWRYLANRPYPSAIPEPIGELMLSPSEQLLPQERTKDFIHERLRQMVILKGLVEISKGCSNPERSGDVIFIHGIVGDAYSTWQPSGENSHNFWLRWLGEDMPGIGIWSLAYEFQSIPWKNRIAPLAQVTKKLLKELERQKIGQRPLIFVGYDLGGFIVKEILRITHKATIPAQKNISGWFHTAREKEYT